MQQYLILSVIFIFFGIYAKDLYFALRNGERMSNIILASSGVIGLCFFIGAMMLLWEGESAVFSFVEAVTSVTALGIITAFTVILSLSAGDRVPLDQARPEDIRKLRYFSLFKMERREIQISMAKTVSYRLSRLRSSAIWFTLMVCLMSNLTNYRMMEMSDRTVSAILGPNTISTLMRSGDMYKFGHFVVIMRDDEEGIALDCLNATAHLTDGTAIRSLGLLGLMMRTCGLRQLDGEEGTPVSLSP